MVTTSYPRRPGDPGGHFVATEVRELVRRGNDVTVLCPGHADARTPDSNESPRIVRIEDHELFGWPGAIPRLQERPSRLLGLGKFAVKARRWLREAGPFDQVVAHWIVPSGWPIAPAAGGPIEIVAHGSDVRLLAQAPFLARLALRKLIAGGATFRVVSEDLLQELVAIAGPEFTRAARVEAARLELPDVPSRESARTRLNVGPEARLVLVVSRLVRNKRLGTAVSAAELIPNAQVVVVGDGPLRPALEQRFPAVRFVGLIPRGTALAWMAAADVLIAASLHEGAPTVVREARALGLPVVAAPAGDLMRWALDDPELWLVAAAPTSPTVQDLD